MKHQIPFEFEFMNTQTKISNECTFKTTTTQPGKKRWKWKQMAVYIKCSYLLVIDENCFVCLNIMLLFLITFLLQPDHLDDL